MAGGVPAGRLSIELVAEIARLQADLDKAKRAVKAASQQIANDAKAANDNLANIGKGSKLAGHHIQNLVFNFQDLGVQMAAAAQSSNPMKMAFTALLQQGSQISGVMMQAGIGVRGLVAEVAGMIGRFLMAHPILAAIGVAAGALYGAFKLFQGQVEKSGEITAYANSLGLTAKEMKKLDDVTVTVGDGFIGLWRTIDKGLGLSTLFASIKAWAVDAFKTALTWVSNFAAAAYSVVMGTVRIMGTIAKAAKQALTGDLSGALTTLVEGRIGDAYANEFGAAKKAMRGFYGDWKANSIQASKDRLKAQADKIKADRTPESNSRGETLAREMQATDALISGLYKLADAYGVSEAAGLREEITAKATAEAIKKQADVATYVAQQIRLAVAERTRDAAKDLAGMTAQTAARAKLNDQVKAGVLTSEEAATQLQNEAQLRPYLVALALAEGDAKTKLAAIIEKLRGAQKAANDEAARTQSLQIAEEQKKATDLVLKETELTEKLGARRLAALKGLRGQALEDELAAINVEHEKAMIFLRAQAVAADQLKRGMNEAAASTMAKARADAALVQKQADIKKEEEAFQRARKRFVSVAEEMGDIIGGKFGRVISQLATILDRFAPGVSAELGKMFGQLDKILGGILKFGGIGAAAATATGGSGLGGTIGGALGGKLGEKVLTKGLEKLLPGLGQFAGPLGSIAGGILGGVIGGLMKKVKKGSQTVEIMAGEAVKTSLTGNSAKLKAAASKMADGLISGLLSIADQLGGALGDGIKVSIGQRDKTFRVDLAGLGRTKNMPKFDTEAEAIEFAISEVIKQGAITGLRAGTATLLKAEGDLQARLQNALKFEGVFKELEQRANPLKSALADIAKEFMGLIDIFEEANATVDDYAKLQELMAIKQQEALKEAFEPIRNMLDDLKSKADAAGDAVRNAYDEILTREADAIEAYQDALARAKQAQQQRWLDIVTTGYNEEIARIQSTLDSLSSSIGSLQDEAKDLAQIAEKLSDFSANIFGGSSAQRAVTFSADAAQAAAQAGDIDALQALKDVAISSATDRATMLRNLAILKNETDKAAGSFQNRASAVEAKIAAAEAQTDALKQQISRIEEQIEIAKAQAESLSAIAETSLSVEDALKNMQTAVAAADQARDQMDKLTELHQTELTFSEAVANYEAAKADRDNLIRDITAAGFADLITVQQQTGSQMVAALAEAAAQAAQARSDAAAAIAAAQAAQAAAATQAANDNYIQDLFGRIPFFAAGGTHSGGLRIVGENGPELEATGPARYYSASQTSGMLSDGGSALKEEIRGLRAEMKTALYQIAKNTGKTASTLDDFDRIGMPDVRDVA